MTITEDAAEANTNAVPTPTNNLNDHKPNGFGRMLRKEDPRLVRGRGQFCDDVTLPGMLHLAILRAPMAHARIISIDKSAAEPNKTIPPSRIALSATPIAKFVAPLPAMIS